MNQNKLNTKEKQKVLNLKENKKITKESPKKNLFSDKRETIINMKSSKIIKNNHSKPSHP